MKANETECPLTLNNASKSTKTQNKKSHQMAPKTVTNNKGQQRAPKAKQTQIDPEGHTSQVK